MSLTSGKHPPQPVPALVLFLTSSTEQSLRSLMLAQMLALLTLLHEQT
jgi:hypothetical protein